MAFSYSGRTIRAILPLQDGKPLFCGIWRKLCDLGIARFKPLRLVKEEVHSVESNYCKPTEFEKNDRDLHIPPFQEADLSNIQFVTSEMPRQRISKADASKCHVSSTKDRQSLGVYSSQQDLLGHYLLKLGSKNRFQKALSISLVLLSYVGTELPTITVVCVYIKD